MSERAGAGKGAIVGALTVLSMLLAIVLLIVYSGFFNVAATEGDAALTEWLLGTTMERSVRSRAGSVGDPIPVDSALLAHGFEHYDAMCAECHSAPGKEPGEYGEGLNPEPPELAEEAHEWSDRELFWITKYGIRMTGMPAFGPTHTDEEIWAIVAAIRELERMSAEEYAAMVAAATGGHGHDEEGGHSRDAEAPDHTHPPSTPPHEH